MIVAEDIDDTLELGRVYANGMHCLRQLRIRNDHAFPIDVRLQSDLDAQVVFQTSNENLRLLQGKLRAHNVDEAAIAVWTTNTVEATEAWSSLLGGSDSEAAAEQQFNLLFNTVNTVEQLRLAPQETRELVLSFLPSDQSARRVQHSVKRSTGPKALKRGKSTANFDALLEAGATPERENTGSFTDSSVRDDSRGGDTSSEPRECHLDEDETFFFQEVQGTLYLLAHSVDEQDPEVQEAKEQPLGMDLERRTSVIPTQPAFVKSIHVSAHICRSFLWSDISGAVISLPDCMPDETYVKDFTVWNRSEIDLYFRLDATLMGAAAHSTGRELAFIDADTGDAVGSRPIPGFGHRRLRATFTPSRVGNYTFDIRLENDNDAGNTEEARIQAAVKALVASESLVVNEDTLDFGVCYSGRPYSRTFAVKNVSDLPVEVHLRVQDAAVQFYPEVRESRLELDGVAPASGMAVGSSISGEVDRMDGGYALLGAGPLTLLADLGVHSQPSALGTDSASRLEPFEELLIKPGVERVIRAIFTPRLDTSSSDYQAGRLLRRTFRIQLLLSSPAPGFLTPQPVKIIQCRAKTCTSFIEISTPIINFGDTDVGVLRSLPLVITNRSELSARVQLRFTSKILSCDRTMLTIPAKQSQSVKFDIYPRKVNPEYRKQIEVVNLDNRTNNRIVEVRSTNVDRRGVSFHSLFYRVITTAGTNFLDFGTVVGSMPVVRALTFDNISAAEVELGLQTSDPSRIRLYSIAGDVAVCPTTDAASRNLSRATGATTREASTGEATAVRPVHTTAPADAASQPMRAELSHHLDTLEHLDLSLPATLRKRRRRRMLTDHGRRIAPLRQPGAEVIGIRPSSTVRREERAPSIVVGSGSALGSSDAVDSSVRPALTPSTMAGMAVHALTAHSPRVDRMQGATLAPSTEHVDDIWKFILSAERELGAIPPVFPSQAAEEAFVQNQVAIRNQLQGYIDDGLLVPIETLTVVAGRRRRIVMQYQAPAQSTASKEEAAGSAQRTLVNAPATTVSASGSSTNTDSEHVALRLLRFEADLSDLPIDMAPWGDLNSIPTRTFLLKARCRRIHLEIGQRSINFGAIRKEERRTNAITIRNRGELPLLYILRKSGSVLSGDILFRGGGQSGVIRGFGSREVEFAYQPSLSGEFSERITVENVLDPGQGGTVLVKAFVRKPTHFYVKPLDYTDLPPFLLPATGSTVVTRPLMVTNTDFQTRTFVARCDTQSLRSDKFELEVSFRVERSSHGGHDGTGALLSEDAQEKIEALEQKMKIARRKGRADKVKKLEDKLDKLRRGTSDEPEIGQGSDTEDAELLTETETATAATIPGDLSANMSRTDTMSDAAEESKRSGADDAVSVMMEEEVPIRVLKTADGSITFSLVGRVTEQVLVDFRLVSKRSGEPSSASDCQALSGSVTVHELKNVDATQEINFTADIFEDEAAYEEALLQWRLVNAVDETTTTELTSAVSESADVSAIEDSYSQSAATPGTLQLESEDDRESTASTLHTLPIDALLSASADALSDTREEDDISIKEIDYEPKIEVTAVHRVLTAEQHASVNGQATLYNCSQLSQQISYTITTANMVSTPYMLTLAAGERQTVLLPFATGQLGWSTLSVQFSLQDGSEWRQTVTFHCYRYSAPLLSFPSLTETDQQEEPALDFGFCYVSESKFAQIVPLLVANNIDDELLISCQSNLTQQVTVFIDEKGTSPATDVTIKARGVATLWVALQPGRGEVRDRDAEVRRLIGGLRFTASLPVPLQFTDELDSLPPLSLGSQILRFTASVGRSMLDISARTINLGWTCTLDEDFYGHLSVKNASARIPAAYSAVCTGGSLSVDRSAGVLATDGDTGGQASSGLVNFRMNSSRYGLLRETIYITNEHDTQQVLSAEIRLLVLNGHLRLTEPLPSGLSLSAADDRDSDRLHSLPTLQWECLPVSLDSSIDNDDVVDANDLAAGDRPRLRLLADDELRQKAIVLENTSNETLHLAVDSELEQPSRWLNAAAQADADVSAAPSYLLSPHDTTTLLVDCASLGDKMFDDAELARLERGETVSTNGLLTVRDTARDQALLVLDVTVPFCVSRGRLEETDIDLGPIGYSNAWQPVPVTVRLCNTSATPLPYELPLLEFMLETTCGEGNVAASDEQACTGCDSCMLRGTVAPLTTAAISFTVYPARLREHGIGEQQHELHIRNLLNPANLLSFRVRFKITTFELRFERLHEQHELRLPTLQYPALADAVPCDTWFKVINTSGDDIRFEIGTEMTPEIARFAKLDVLSRFSNSPLKGGVSLSPNGSIEVRVVASIQRGVRLPADMRTAICDTKDDSGLFDFGKIWVTTRPSTEVESRLREDIPVRGTLSEVRAFAVTERVSQLVMLEEQPASDDSSVEHDVLPAEEERRRTLLSNSAHFILRNLSRYTPVTVRLELENPPGLPLGSLLYFRPALDSSSSDEQSFNQLTVPAEEQLSVYCSLVPSTHRLPESIRIRIFDVDAFGEQSHSLVLRTPAQAKRASHIVAAAAASASQVASSPTLDTVDSRVLSGGETGSTSIAGKDTSAAASMAGSAIPFTASAPHTTPLTNAPSGHTPLARLVDSLEVPPQFIQHSLFTVRGCRRINDSAISGDQHPYHRFALDLGQLDVGGSPAVRSLVVSLSSDGEQLERVPYAVRVIPASAASWLSVSRSRGCLESSRARIAARDTSDIDFDGSRSSDRGESIADTGDDDDHSGSDEEDDGRAGGEQTLTVSAQPRYISAFAAHLVIEPLTAEAAPSVVIRVNMEVVAKQNIRRSAPAPARPSGPIFSVAANCLQSNDAHRSIELPFVCYHTEYVMRSVTIHNHDSVTLPFTVTADMGGDPSDVIFSTSRTSAKLFSTLYIDGGHSARVYIRFRPQPTAAVLAAHTDAPADDTTEHKHIRIYVGCRLVKDYQYAIQLHAHCHWPSLTIHNDVLDFRGHTHAADSAGKDVEVSLAGNDAPERSVAVRNISTRAVQLFLLNDTTFFDIAPATAFSTPLAPSATQLYTVTPRLGVLQQHIKTVRKEKYICETVCIYNAERPKERQWITLRITLDQSRYVQAIAVTHIDFAYDRIERRIAQLYSWLEQPDPAQRPSPTSLSFAFRYLVDQLCYYCTIKTGDQFFQLACLLFSWLLCPLEGGTQRVTQDTAVMESWRQGLREFLSVFPTANDKLNDLRCILDTPTDS